MEIGAFLRLALRRLWIVVVFAVIAAAVAWVVVRNTKTEYQAKVRYTVPPAAATTAGSNGQYIENFSVALTSDPVVGAVAKATGIATGDLKSGLGAAQVKNSSFVDITYADRDKTTASRVATAATKDTADSLAQPLIDQATSAVNAAKTAVTGAQRSSVAAQRGLTDFETKNGGIDPNVQYRAVQAQLNGFQTSKLAAQARGDGTGSYDSAISAAQKQLQTLSPLVRQYNALTLQSAQAQTAATSAQTRLAQAQTDLATASAPPLYGAAQATLQKARTKILRTVAIGAGIGLVLGIALVILLESRPRRRAEPPRSRAARHGENGKTDLGDPAASDTVRSDSDRPDGGGGATVKTGPDPTPATKVSRG